MTRNDQLLECHNEATAMEVDARLRIAKLRFNVWICAAFTAWDLLFGVFAGNILCFVIAFAMAYLTRRNVLSHYWWADQLNQTQQLKARILMSFEVGSAMV